MHAITFLQIYMQAFSAFIHCCSHAQLVNTFFNLKLGAVSIKVCFPDSPIQKPRYSLKSNAGV